MKYSAKLNRHERRIAQAEKLKNSLSGTGLYIYENNTDGDLKLPKATASGVRHIGPRKRFQGDSYFMKWVGHPMNLLRLIEEVVPKMTTAQIAEKIAQENNMSNDKLILDQPDTVTTKGKVEHVVADTDPQPLHDSNENKATPEILLTENPLDGVAIIRG
jgi:hypothetical protein